MPTNAVCPDGMAEEFTYAANGLLLSASRSVRLPTATADCHCASRLAFSYDTMNRLESSETRVAGQTFGVSYAYDLGGLCTNVTYPGGLRVRYAYDLDGRVTNVTDWAGRSFAFTRDAAGRLTALSYPNGVSGAWTHDARHSVASWSYNNGSPLVGRTITRDEAGVKTKEQVTAGLFPNPQGPRLAQNVFDAADRLTSATVAEGTNTFAETYLYDLNGALTNKQSAIGNGQYEYDCAGRMTFASTGNATLSVTYDALGNRLTTCSANATHLWVTDHADPRKRPLMETDSNGTPVRYFIWGGGLLLAVVEADGTVRNAHSDEQGSVVALTDSSGALTDQYCYGPYGTDWGHTGTNSIPFRWPGSHGVFNVGGSALHLTRYRAYDTCTGRFLSPDPLGLGGGPNLYSYCKGNPLAYIDPLGLGAEATWVDWLQGGLDVVVVFDPTGISDALNALIYLGQGEYAYAAISAVVIVPYVGGIGKAGKYGAKAIRLHNCRNTVCLPLAGRDGPPFGARGALPRRGWLFFSYACRLQANGRPVSAFLLSVVNPMGC